jgi:hypothetical protein
MPNKTAVALACGSMSINSTAGSLWPAFANNLAQALAILTAVVVFPEPPFWFKMVMILGFIQRDSFRKY